METKEVKIQVPEGYEIDKENSTFECVKFKPIKKDLTYEDVAKELFEYKYCVFYDSRGRIYETPCLDSDCCLQPNKFKSIKQAEKLLAINKLMNVAKYLNCDWKPDWNDGGGTKYFLGIKEHFCRAIYIDFTCNYNFSIVYFKTRELAQQAIDILGEETIRLALSTDW